MPEVVLRDRNARPVLGVTDDLLGLDLFGRTLGGVGAGVGGSFANGSAAAPSIAFASEPLLGLFRITAGNIGFSDGLGTTGGAWLAGSGFGVTSQRAYNFSNSTTDPSTIDTQLLRFAAGVLGTSALSATGALTSFRATAIPAGGTAGTGWLFSSTANYGVFFGSGAPTLTAAKGSLYLRSDGSSTSTRAYVNTDGGTTWTAITTVA